VITSPDLIQLNSSGQLSDRSFVRSLMFKVALHDVDDQRLWRTVLYVYSLPVYE